MERMIEFINYISPVLWGIALFVLLMYEFVGEKRGKYIWYIIGVSMGMVFALLQAEFWKQILVAVGLVARIIYELDVIDNGEDDYFF